jgi:vancomycin permeability regulator SanA
MKQKILAFLKRHKRFLTTAVAVIVLSPLLLVLLAYALIEPYKKDIVDLQNVEHTHVGLVLGAGVAPNGKPYKELKARLDLAARALEQGKVDKLLLSGDNRFQYYDEPTAMLNYMVQEKHIPKDKLQVDFAGRSTYESCERTARVFDQHKVVIISARSHLPRAIYLCKQFGVQARGIATDIEANNSFRREALARVKALINVYVFGERTVLGSRIKM